MCSARVQAASTRCGDNPRVPEAAAELEGGRRAFERQAWAEAYESLSAADRAGSLAPSDLELLATSAYMTGRAAKYLAVLERAHAAHLHAGEPLAALRCAFWIGATLAERAEMGRAGGWLARARRLLEAEGDDRPERGYLLLPLAFEQVARGDLAAAAATAGEAVAVGERFGDPDLLALAAQLRGTVLIRAGRLDEGLGLLDEAMVAVAAGETSPIPSGIVYCGVILACQSAHEVGRAQEWTAALSEWCERQPELVAFTGRCLIHRAELMQLRGAWQEGVEEARRACERALAAENRAAAGEACYRQGEIYRLRGELAEAEECYREASRHGREPQPGLALLRLAQGRVDAATAVIDRALAETAESARRVALLPAAVEIMLAAGATNEARAAAGELERLTEGQATPMLEAIAASARGAVELACDDAPGALVGLRRGWELWQHLGAVYEAARGRVLVGLACRALGDEEAAALELEAAREVFERLGAAPDLDRIDALGRIGGEGEGEGSGLSARELEVLRLVAAGNSNRAIAAELVISEHTVARHLQNIFAKLGVSSRTAATAYAYEQRLV
jgi:ATP/maltotriose-dependent transcriptional regulator MalT